MRQNRQYSPSGIYHIVIRGCNKQNIFYGNEDKIYFLNLLKTYCKRKNIRIHAYCLMDNHVHLLIEDIFKTNISSFMQLIESIYARYFNKKYDRIGHLFQNRFLSEIITNNQYFLTAFRYILNNQKNSGNNTKNRFQWTSLSCYKQQNTFIYKNLIFDLLENLQNLIRFINQTSDDFCLEPELRPSEKEQDYIDRIKKVLKTENPIIKPDIPRELILEKIHLLKQNGLSLRTISRITGIGLFLVRQA